VSWFRVVWLWLCSDHAPDVFRLLEDGIAYVVEDGVVCNDPGGGRQAAFVPRPLHTSVIHASEVCPGECIFLEAEGAERASGVSAHA